MSTRKESNTTKTTKWHRKKTRNTTNGRNYYIPFNINIDSELDQKPTPDFCFYKKHISVTKTKHWLNRVKG
jgi:hypothetical protein